MKSSASRLSMLAMRASMAASRAILATSAARSRLSGARDTAAVPAPSSSCHSTTRSWRSRTIVAKPGLPLAPRAAICASNVAASELCAHCQ